MLRHLLTSKIHRATVTEADLHYVGSITIDAELMAAARLTEGERVMVVDVTNGNRLETYAIPGIAGSGVIGINGAAAHLVSVDDVVILMAFSLLDDAEQVDYRPEVVFVDRHNHVVDHGHDASGVPPGYGLFTSESVARS